jgi:Glycosyltransferase GT-D fold
VLGELRKVIRGTEAHSVLVQRQNRLAARQVELLTAICQELKTLRPIREELVQQRKILDVLRARLTSDVTDEVRAFTATRQLGLGKTIEKLAQEELSFARFGDGELRLMTHDDYRIGFQANSPALQQALRESLTRTYASGIRLLIGFPQVFRDVNGSLVWASVWSDLKRLIPEDVTFGNSHVTRPLVFQYLGEEAVRLWRAVWDGRSVCVITGKNSRFKLIPELFDNVAEARFIYSTPVDAFSDLDNVMNKVLAQPEAQIYLIALGPAGTVLAVRLALNGLRAIDIGHISDSYLNVFNGEPWPETKHILNP